VFFSFLYDDITDSVFAFIAEAKKNMREKQQRYFLLPDKHTLFPLNHPACLHLFDVIIFGMMLIYTVLWLLWLNSEWNHFEQSVFIFFESLYFFSVEQIR
jgi:hypothetical protein